MKEDDGYIRQVFQKIDDLKKREDDEDDDGRRKVNPHVEIIKSIRKIEDETKTTKDYLHRLINVGFYRAPTVWKKIDLKLRDVAENKEEFKDNYSDTLQISWRGIGCTNRSNFKYISDFGTQVKILSDKGCVDKILPHLDKKDKEQMTKLHELLVAYKNKTTSAQLQIDITIPAFVCRHYGLDKKDYIVNDDTTIKGRIKLSDGGAYYGSQRFHLEAERKEAKDEYGNEGNKHKQLLDVNVIKSYENVEELMERMVLNHYYSAEQEMLMSKLKTIGDAKDAELKALHSKIVEMFEHKLTLQRMLGVREETFN